MIVSERSGSKATSLKIVMTAWPTSKRSSPGVSACGLRRARLSIRS